MVWDIAAGIIIGGAALGLVSGGFALQAAAFSQGDRDFALGWLMALVGLGLAAWTIFFKAHFA